MPSSYTLRIRLEQQFTGENINTWGIRLNTVIGRVDFSIAGWTEIALTASRALTASNNADDEARSAALKFTGAGGFAVTLPGVSKAYYVWNAAAAAITLTTGSGTTVIVDPGDTVQIFCDGVNVTQLGINNQSIKDYIQSVAFSYNAGNLPAQAGNAGKFVFTNGTAASWKQVQTTDIGDWQTNRDAITDEAIAFAVAF